MSPSDVPNHGGFLNDPTSDDLPIYMNFRDELPPQTQTLTVSGTDMTGNYIQGSSGGTALINLDGATVDLIEAGGAAPRTDVTIDVKGSTLNGAKTGEIYDVETGRNKDYTRGSAIYIDPVDLGDHTIAVHGGSKLNGSIITGGTGAQTVSIDGSTINTGGIYVFGVTDNTISLTNSTVDATNSGVAANLAIGVFGGQSSLTLVSSTVTGNLVHRGPTSEPPT